MAAAGHAKVWLRGSFVEYPCMAGLLFVAVGGNPPSVIVKGAADSMVGVIFQAAFLGLMLALVTTRLRRVLRVVSQMWPVGLAAVAALSSCLWSQDASISLRMGTAYVVVSLFSIFLAVRFSPERLMDLVLRTGLVAGVLGVLVSVLVPSMGLDALNGGAWQGIFAAKNNCAADMLFFVAPLLACPRLCRRAPVLSAALLLTAGLLIVKADSKMAWLLVAFSLGLLTCLKQARRFQPKSATLLRILTGVGGAAALVVLYVSVPVLLAMLGKDSDFGARVPIWKAVLDRIRERALLGYGFQAFWRADPGQADLTMRSIGFHISNAQNGWLDVLLQVGLVGLVPTSLIFTKAARDLLRVPKLLRGPWRDWAILTLTLILVYQLDESMLLDAYKLPWLLTISACTMLHLRVKAGAASGEDRAAVRVPAGLEPVFAE